MMETQDQEKPRILVTGATELVGAHVARALLKRGYRVRAMRPAQGEMRFVQDLKVGWAQADWGDPAAIEDALGGCAGVIHCAGYAPRDGLDIDAARRQGVAQMRLLLECSRAQKVDKIVYVSSSATLGFTPADPQIGLDEDDYYVPGTLPNAYYEAKWAMEAEVYRTMLSGMGAVVAIPGVALGPGDARAPGVDLLARLAHGKLWGLLGQSVNVVDARDLGTSLVRALEQGRPGRRYIMGGHNLQVDALAAMVSDLAGSRPPRVHLPPAPVRGLARLVERAGRRLGVAMPPLVVTADRLTHSQRMSNQRARAEIGHAVRPLARTLNDTLDWVREYDALSHQA